MKNDEQVRTYIRKNKDGTFRAEYRIVGPCTAYGKGRAIARVIFAVNKDQKINVKHIDSEKYREFIASALKIVTDINNVPLGAERMSMTAYVLHQIGYFINASEADQTNLAEKTPLIIEDPNTTVKED